ncbi:MAG TPA: PQQ-binding-like beta-propeller repeat protein, partial [Armatimonadota bacterium]|nr:PQQ-binding-like beta-propeller repeat protein [Armatimonadota bacterium]
MPHRFRPFAALLIAAATGLVALAPAPAQTGGDWPSFRGKAQMTGVAHSPLPATLSLKWTYETGSSVQATAAIVGDTVYVGTMTGALVAIDLAGGGLKWKYLTGGNPIASSPAVVGDSVYFGDQGGVFHAV